MTKRPAHRPSRRTAVADAAMRMFARRSPEAVTVAEIAEEAGMTSAAVYYHFASKDDILLEGLRAFGADLVAQTRRLHEQPSTSLGELVTGLLEWTQDFRDAATVWFVYSAGLSQPVESLRREVRAELVRILLRAARVARPDASAPERAVLAAAVLALIDTAAASWLANDDVLQTLGAQGFLAATAELADRVAAS